ncbi:hypothetical protein HanIR_Chr05g0237811 [Helianthus annuus]|nr:hypothetical protein HanIR_Chr05g0237811 [Helianthus annuus]
MTKNEAKIWNFEEISKRHSKRHRCARPCQDIGTAVHYQVITRSQEVNSRWPTKVEICVEARLCSLRHDRGRTRQTSEASRSNIVYPNFHLRRPFIPDGHQ